MMADELRAIGKNFGIAMAHAIGVPFTIDPSEIDQLTSVTIANSTDLTYDFDRDGTIDGLDRQFYVENVWNTRFGDANLDGRFDSGDLVQVFKAAQYEDDVTGNSTWSTGDWDGDFEFTTRDLIAAFRVRDTFGTMPVPESTFGPIGGACLALMRRSRDPDRRHANGDALQTSDERLPTD